MRDDVVASRWLEVVTDLLERAPAAPPRDAVATELMASFSGDGTSFLRQSGQHLCIQMYPRAYAPSIDSSSWELAPMLAGHPMVRWWRATGELAAQATDLLPRRISDPRAFSRWRERVGAYGGLPHQLTIPLELRDDGMTSYTVTRGGRPFTADEVELARRLQRLLIGLGRHVEAIRGLPTDAAAAYPHLTSREAAVLGLLAHGWTAGAIARRLGCSPRTVHKHLERIYTKLHVRDRLTAVMRAQEAGLLPVER